MGNRKWIIWVAVCCLLLGMHPFLLRPVLIPLNRDGVCVAFAKCRGYNVRDNPF